MYLLIDSLSGQLTRRNSWTKTNTVIDMHTTITPNRETQEFFSTVARMWRELRNKTFIETFGKPGPVMFVASTSGYSTPTYKWAEVFSALVGVRYSGAYEHIDELAKALDISCTVSFTVLDNRELCEFNTMLADLRLVAVFYMTIRDMIATGGAIPLEMERFKAERHAERKAKYESSND